MRKNENKTAEVINASIKELGGYLDANLIMSKPQRIGEQLTILPVSKVTFGFLNGGGEYGEVKLFSKTKSHPFAGGNGGIVNLSPCGFLIVKNGSSEFVKVGETAVENIAEKAINFIKNISTNENEKN